MLQKFCLCKKNDKYKVCLCPRLPGCYIDKPVSKAKEILAWLVWESDQGNCCCPSCNERSGSHRLVARGRSRSTCFYFVYFLHLFYFYLQSPSLPFLAHLLHFFLIDDPNCLLPATFVSWPLSVPPLVWALQLVCATGSARWLCTLVGGNKLRNKWLGPDSLHGIALR